MIVATRGDASGTVVAVVQLLGALVGADATT